MFLVTQFPFQIHIIAQLINSHAFTSSGGDFCEGVITAVTLATYDSSLTGALPGDGVTGPGLRAN